MPSKRQLLQESIMGYLNAKRQRNRSVKTLASAEWVLRKSFNALANAGLETCPKKINEKEIFYLMEKVYTGSPYYKRWMLSFVSDFLKTNGNSIVERMQVEWPRQERISVDWLSDQEEQAVWNIALNASEPIEQVIVALELGLGYRRVEVIRQSLDEIRGRSIHALGKGRQGGKWRTLQLNELVEQSIGTRCFERERIINRAKKTNARIEVPGTLLFYLREGELRGYSESGIDKILARFRERVEQYYGRKFDFSNHTLRRTFGHRQWKLRTPIETISDMLGHENVEMTKRYIGVTLEDQEEPMRKQDEWVRSLGVYPKKDIMKLGQELEWAQGDLDS